MADRIRNLKKVTAIAALALVAACSQQTNTYDTSSAEGVTCLPIDEANYTFQNGKFYRASAAAPAIVERVVVQQADRAWYEVVEAGFPDKGYSWMGLNVRRNTATLLGLAPDAATKQAAFETGRDAILATPEGANFNIIDGISIEGGEQGVGAALAALDDTPSLASCQKAFSDTMQGRNVQFRVGSANILSDSARLLNAVSGVASLCNAYNIEIGGHTDQIGDAGSNQRLSQSRATAVLVYLEGKGVDISNISAVGYGETRPVDTSGTRAGNALNRRTEFTVSER